MTTRIETGHCSAVLLLTKNGNTSWSLTRVRSCEVVLWSDVLIPNISNCPVVSFVLQSPGRVILCEHRHCRNAMQLNHLHFQSFKTVFTEVVVKKYEVCLLRFTIRIRHKSMRSSPRYPMTNSSNHLFRRRVTRPDTRPPTCLFDLGT